jgi:hypothetical protein
MNYTQCFKLQPDGAGSYFVLRSYGHSTYQEGAGNKHNDAVSAGGLGIEGGNLVSWPMGVNMKEIFQY